MEKKNMFVEGLVNENNQKETENGAQAYKSTLNSLLDFFAVMGACRNRSKDEVYAMFEKAFAEDALLTLKALFYLRNVRGGLGERRVTRDILERAADEHTADILVNLENIAKFGRLDDLYVFVGTRLENYAFDFLKKLYDADMAYLKQGEIHKLSLVGKWLKSTNTSSQESRKLGRLTAKKFGLKEKDYRKNLSALRAALDIVERKASSKEWSTIDYEKLPSLAALKYRAAFYRNDADRYAEFLKAVSTGEKKINADTLYPYDLVQNYISKRVYDWQKREYVSAPADETIEAQWKALPNYVTDKDFLIMADVSGSMSGRPMDTSVGLAIYFAERNKGLYHNKFMTFSSTPELVTLPEGASLAAKVNVTMMANWNMSTNLEAAFNLVLNAAIKSNCKQSDLPSAIVVITDMEIDNYGNSKNLSFSAEMKQRFAAAGYEMPVVVWWNVNARQNTFHATAGDNYVRFISGQSAAVFKGLCEKMGATPLELMLGILNDPVYEVVKLAR